MKTEQNSFSRLTRITGAGVLAITLVGTFQPPDAYASPAFLLAMVESQIISNEQRSVEAENRAAQLQANRVAENSRTQKSPTIRSYAALPNTVRSQ